MAEKKQRGVNITARVPLEHIGVIDAHRAKTGETESAYFAKAAHMRATGNFTEEKKRGTTR